MSMFSNQNKIKRLHKIRVLFRVLSELTVSVSFLIRTTYFFRTSGSWKFCNSASKVHFGNYSCSVQHNSAPCLFTFCSVPPNDPKKLCGRNSYPDFRSFRKWRIGDTNMAAAPLFRGTNMAAVTSRGNTLSGLKITAGCWPVKMTGQTKFYLGHTLFLTGQI